MISFVCLILRMCMRPDDIAESPMQVELGDMIEMPSCGVERKQGLVSLDEAGVRAMPLSVLRFPAIVCL